MSSATRIQNALEKKFGQHRIIFWYDDELIGWQEEFAAVQLADVVKIEVKNNEFGIKHRLSREQRTRNSSSIFVANAKPADPENWLLDQLLANGGAAFFPDRATLAQIEAGFPPEFRTITVAHPDFFFSADRTNRIRALIKDDDTARSVRLKMLAVVCRTEASIEAVLLVLFAEISRNAGERWQELEKYGLTSVFWQETSAFLGYQSASPGLLDLCLAIFSQRRAQLRWPDTDRPAAGASFPQSLERQPDLPRGVFHALRTSRSPAQS